MPRLSVAAALSVLTGAMQTGVEKRQAFDPPERLIEGRRTPGLDRLLQGLRLRDEGRVSKRASPWPAPYGGRIRAAAVYLNVQS